jgi:hypothetical protein
VSKKLNFQGEESFFIFSDFIEGSSPTTINTLKSLILSKLRFFFNISMLLKERKKYDNKEDNKKERKKTFSICLDIFCVHVMLLMFLFLCRLKKRERE